MPRTNRTRKSSELSPQKSRPSPAKFVKLSTVSADEELEERRALKSLRKSLGSVSLGALSSEKNDQNSSGTLTPQRQSSTQLDAAQLGAMTPMPKLPILANFEEWLSLSSSNKLQTSNYWDLALIDYFHDMSLLKDERSGEINFQKASVTLDGCVKIYNLRVDSVVSETGKLLNGLQTSKEAQVTPHEDENEEGEEDEETVNRTAKRKKTSQGSTLVKNFDAIRMKKIDVDSFVDPLFKKTLAELDEGGAKGLLMNHLNIDGEGRLIFDTEDALLTGTGEEEEEEAEEEGDHEELQTDVPAKTYDFTHLGMKYFPELYNHPAETYEIRDDGEAGELDPLGHLHICPTLRNLNFDQLMNEIPALSAEPVEDLAGYHNGIGNMPGEGTTFLEEPSDADGDQGLIPLFDHDEDADFGQVADFVLPPQDGYLNSVNGVSKDAQSQGLSSAHALGSYLGFGQGVEEADDEQNVFRHFDTIMNKSWSGKAWKIAKLQASSRGFTTFDATGAPGPEKKRERKPKEVVYIDFFTDAGHVDEETILAPGGSAINLAKNARETKSRNLLDDDLHFQSQDLLALFLKPQARIRTRGGIRLNSNILPGGAIDPSHVRSMAVEDMAKQLANQEQDMDGIGINGLGQEERYDANFFSEDIPTQYANDSFYENDDDQGIPSLAGALQTTQHNPQLPGTQGNETFGSKLLALSKGRNASESLSLNFAKRAKRVDVKVLKDNLWKKLDLPSIDAADSQVSQIGSDGNKDEDAESGTLSKNQGKAEGERKFSELIGQLSDVYEEKERAELSTSFCFICLLHLANEKGLKIESDHSLGVMRDLTVTRDETVLSVDTV